MPNIPVYNSKAGIAGPANQANATAEGFGGNIGRAVQGLGQTIQGIGEVIYKREEEKDLFEAQKAVTQAHLDWQEKLETAKREAPEGAPDFAKTIKEQYDGWLEQSGERFNTRRGQEYFQLHAMQLKNSIVSEGITFEAQAYGKKQASDLQKILVGQANLVRTDPAKLEETLAQTEKLIENTPFWTNQQRIQARDQFSKDLYDSAIDGRVAALEANPDVSPAQVAAVREDIVSEKGEWQKNTSIAMYDGALKRLDQLQRSATDRQDGLAREVFHDDMDQWQTTGVNKRGYTEADAEALAKDSADRYRLVREFRTAENVGEEVARTQDTPLVEDARRIDAMGAGLGTTSDFKADNAKFQAAKTAFKQKRDAFVADPAGYTIRTSPSTRWAYEKFQNDQNPTTWKNFATVTKFDQQRIGGKDATPKLLPKALVENIAVRMNEAKTSEDAAVRAGRLLGEFQNTFGDTWPKATAELRAEKAIDDFGFVAANLMAAGNGKLATEVLVAGSRDKEELASMSGMTMVKAREAAVAAMEPLTKSLSAAPDGLALSGAYTETLTRVLLARGAAQGRNTSRDAREIADQMILNNYEFSDTLRVPRGRDADSIARATRGIQRGLGDIDVVVPPSNLSGDIAKDSYVSSVAEHGYWVTAPDESGAYLVNGAGDPVYERSGGQVRRVQRSWSDLEASR